MFEALRGERPPVRIDGAVDFASDLQWLADNLRWDIEDDMARVIGDVPAHPLVSVARSAAHALPGFVRSGARGNGRVAHELEPDQRLAVGEGDADRTLLRACEQARGRLDWVYTGNLSSAAGRDSLCPSCGTLLVDRAGYRGVSRLLPDATCPGCRAPQPFVT